MTPIDSSELINTDDFQSIEIRISMSNSTTRTEVRPTGPDNTTSIRMQEFEEQRMILEVPKNSCAEGHHLLLNFHATGPNNVSVTLNTTAKVESLETGGAGDSNVRIRIFMIQYDEASWHTFKELFSNRQKEIEYFFNAVKGL